MLPIVVLLLVGLAAPCGAADADPADTVRRYMRALQASDFEAAYPLVTAAMAQDKSREQWITEQRWATQTCDVAILAFEVFPGTVDGQTARVPARVRSRDAFAGGAEVEEHELYTLVRDGEAWRISQQQIVEPAQRPTWFPAAAAPPPAP